MGTAYKSVCNAFADKYGKVWSTTGIIAEPRGAPAITTAGPLLKSQEANGVPSGQIENTAETIGTSAETIGTPVTVTATAGQQEPDPVESKTAPAVSTGNGGTGTLPISSEPETQTENITEGIQSEIVEPDEKVVVDIKEEVVSKQSEQQAAQATGGISTGGIIGIIFVIIAFISVIIGLIIKFS